MTAEGAGTPPGVPGPPGPPGNGERADMERLEQLLRQTPAPAPRSPFATELRAAFTAGALSAKGAGSPSLAGFGGRNAPGVIEDLLMAEPPPRSARAAFQEDLRRRFVHGELTPGSTGEEGRRAPRRARSRPVLRLVAGSLAAAAALWLVAHLLIPGGPAWRARLAEGEGPVLVDGRPFDPRDLSELGRAFAAGRVLSSEGRRIELIRDGELALALLPGTEIERLSEGTDGGDLRLAVRSGELYLKSRPGYAGPPVIVETPDMDMRMTGTVVGVLFNGTLSCICVARGAVHVRSHLHPDAAPLPCPSAARRVIFSDGHESADAFADLPEGGGTHVSNLQTFAQAEFP